MSTSGSLPSDLKGMDSTDILRPSDGTAQLEHIKQQGTLLSGEQSMDCVDGGLGKYSSEHLSVVGVWYIR